MIKPSAKNGCVNILQDTGVLHDNEIMSFNTIFSLDQSFFFSTKWFIFHWLLLYQIKSTWSGQLKFHRILHDQVWDYQLSVSMNGTLDSTGYSRDREDASFFTAYTFSPTWFAAINLGYQRNLELDIARRYQQMIGGGNKLMVRQILPAMP